MQASGNSPRLAAATLGAYIRNLPQPLVPQAEFTLLAAAIETEVYGERIAAVRDAVSEMPEANQAVLHRLCAFLARLAGRSTGRGNSLELLAAFWCPLILPEGQAPRARAARVREFRVVGLMLQQCTCIFQGSLDAFEIPELQLPSYLQAQLHQEASRAAQWKRVKASLLRDSRGQFKIQVREDPGGIYLDTIARNRFLFQQWKRQPSNTLPIAT